jgi:hypothetical protein
MAGHIVLGSALVFILTGPVLAGPCTQRITELEKSITAPQEGAGPAMSTPTTTAAPAQPNQNMQMVQQAKELDKQGKEAECMNMVNKISSTAPSATK